MTVNPVAVIRYQLDNHLGSASLELDETADIISYEKYHPFGTTSYRSGRTETETSLKRYKYVGKERDEETGLYYYGARMYDPSLGRFMNPDPLAEKFHSWSPYSYCFNNPMRFTDPTGMSPDDQINKILESMGLTQGYVVSSNNETGAVTVSFTSASYSESSTRTNASLALTQSTYTFGADGNLSASQTTTSSVSAELELSTNLIGGQTSEVTNVESAEIGYESYNSSDNKGQLASIQESDPVLDGVSQLLTSFNGNMLRTQDSSLPNLSAWDQIENKSVPFVSVFNAIAAGGETFGLERYIPVDATRSTTLQIPKPDAYIFHNEMYKLSKSRKIRKL